MYLTELNFDIEQDLILLNKEVIQFIDNPYKGISLSKAPPYLSYISYSK